MRFYSICKLTSFPHGSGRAHQLMGPKSKFHIALMSFVLKYQEPMRTVNGAMSQLDNQDIPVFYSGFKMCLIFGPSIDVLYFSNAANGATVCPEGDVSILQGCLPTNGL